MSQHNQMVSDKIPILLEEMRKKGITFFIQDEKLKLKVPRDTQIEPELWDVINESKKAIKNYVQHNNSNNAIITIPIISDKLKFLPLSFVQQRIWFIDKLQGSVHYHMPRKFLIEGSINFEALEFSFREILHRHKILRTVIKETDGVGYQHILSHRDWKLNFVNEQNILRSGETIETFISSAVDQPYNLSKDFVLRASYIERVEQNDILLIVIHHIGFDGWSESIMATELSELYEARLQKRPVLLAPLPIQYADYAHWQLSDFEEQQEAKLEYWRNKVSNVNVLSLPTDYPRPVKQSLNGATIVRMLKPELAVGVQLMSKEEQVTDFMTLLTVFNILLFKYTGQKDICVGTAIAGRNQAEIEGLIGPFINTLPLRTVFYNDDSFVTLLQKIKSTTLEAYEHQDVPFEKIVQITKVERGNTNSPLFQVIFAMQNKPETNRIKLSEVTLIPVLHEKVKCKYDIDLNVFEWDGQISFNLTYCTDLFDKGTIENLLTHYENLIEAILKNRQMAISELTMFSQEAQKELIVGSSDDLQADEEDFRKILYQFNDTAVTYPSDKTIVSLFEEQAFATPNNIAVYFNGSEFTYRELNDRSNQFANYLKTQGLIRENLVPIYLQESVEMLVAILGILKAGGAYVPIDPNLPKQRIEYMLDDCQAQFLVCNTKFEKVLTQLSFSVKLVNIEDNTLYNQYGIYNPEFILYPNNLAYVMYTSGSTGKPKGVMVEHRNVVSLVKGTTFFNIDESDIVRPTGAPSFDASTFEYWGVLLNGAKLVLSSLDTLLDKNILKAQIISQKVTKMWFTTSLLNQLVDDDISIFSTLKGVIFGGEKASEKHIKALRSEYPELQIVNGYGPTENTTFSTVFNLRGNDDYQTTPIGKPLENRTIFILNSRGQLLPIGIPGELYVGGAGVSRGYLNLTELTEERFIASPFVSGDRLYRTGDLGRWLDDGNIEFLGRLDDQVKVRGYRIELGEIERILSEVPGVKQCVIMLREISVELKGLVAYIVMDHDFTFDKEYIIEYLQLRLPEYMMPDILKEITSIPLTYSGKINKEALPDVTANSLKLLKFIAPTDDIERKIALIWQDLLGVDTIGVYDDFFDLGGHSLLATRAVSRLQKEFSVNIGINNFFSHSTIISLANYLRELIDIVKIPPVSLQQKPNNIPLSYAQERLWFLDRLQGSVQYHIPFVFQLNGALDKSLIESSFKEIIRRHQVLRTIIQEKDGIPFQKIISFDEWEITEVDGTEFLTADSLTEHIASYIQVPFDLTADYMLRVQLVRLSETHYKLIVVLHHIAFDGWSLSILVREIVALFKSYRLGEIPNLPTLSIQYADYAIWQSKHLTDDVLSDQIVYWKRKLSDLTPLYLPTDFPRGNIQSTRGNTLYYNIDKSLTDLLQQLSQNEGATLFMTMLSVFKILMYRYTNQEDLSVGVAIANRTQKETEEIIGFFVNALVIRSSVDKKSSFRQFLSQVKESTLEGYTYQDVPFEKVIEAVVGKRDIVGNSLVQVMFVLQNTPDVPEFELGDLTIKREVYHTVASRFDISFDLRQGLDGIQVSIMYCSDLFKKETIDRMFKHYHQLLTSVVRNFESPISFLQMLTDSEEKQILCDFNDTDVDYQQDKTLIHLFQDNAEFNPDNIAVVFGKKKLSYRELNQKANMLANYLIGKGVGNKVLVPLCVDRSLEMIISILGILKAGGTYVPIDPDYPKDRIEYMLKDTSARIAVSKQNFVNLLKGKGNIEFVIEVDRDWDAIKKHSNSNPDVQIAFTDLMYIIYTSGSTGKPKGVLLEHKSLLNFVLHQTKLFDIKSDDRVLQFYNYCFDPSIEQIFLPLINGAVCVLISDDTRRDIYQFEQFLRRMRITHLQATPGFLNNLKAGRYGGLRRVIAGGEICTIELRERWRGICQFYNKYGPTETAITATEYPCLEDIDTTGFYSLPIGKPVSNTRVYILDKNLQLVPIGVAGELHVSGIQVARGYLNREELTNEKFVSNPFLNGERMYKTGDLGKWLPDGNIQYIGRIDDQVKIRGYRIEPGEVESVMNDFKEVVTNAVVVKKDSLEMNKLVSYFVPDRAVVELKEEELFQKRLEDWKELNEAEYSKTDSDDADAEFNITGWNESFTGNPIPVEQMREWLDDIVRVILCEPAGNVFEIGCGTGLIYYSLAGLVDKYTGTDLSSTSISQIRKRIAQNHRNYGPTELKVCPAHEVTISEDEKVDTVVLNSVIQYFPSEQYLSDVIDRSIGLLRGKGRIIIGDVRDNRLLKLFKGRLYLEKLQGGLSIQEFEWRLNQEVLNEEELCVSPEYFYNLKAKHSQITHIEIQWKQGIYENELNLYRYTVVIYVGDNRKVIQPEWKDFELESLIHQIDEGKEIIAIKSLNPRLNRDRRLHETLENKVANTISDIFQYVFNTDNEQSNKFQKGIKYAELKGYQCKIFLDNDIFRINVLLESQPSSNFVQSVFNVPKTSCTSTPLFNEINLLLQKDIRRQLSDQLPDYMLPTDIVACCSLPVNNNGKIDRKFLIQLENEQRFEAVNYVAPATETEKKIAQIWQEALRIDHIGIYEDFFELGGHSLLATRVVSSIRKELQVDLNIREFFINPTITSLAAYLLEQEDNTVLAPIISEPRSQKIPLSFAQERLWFIDKLQNGSEYNMPFIFDLQGEINLNALNLALREVLYRHEILRTIIYEENGIGYQRVKPVENWEIKSLLVEQVTSNQYSLTDYITSCIQESFNLKEDYMLRVHLVRLSATHHKLIVVLHHIAFDGWSLSILVREMVALYKSYYLGKKPILPVPSIQYADYAIWQQKYLTNKVLSDQTSYWKKKLSDISPLYLPTDYPRTTIQSTRGNTVYFNIDKSLTDQLRQLSQSEGVTLFMTMLSVFKILMYRYTNQEDISVGVAIANRTQKETEEIIGFFVNALVIRSSVDKQSSFKEFLNQVKMTTLEGYTYQDVPFEKVIEAVVGKRDIIGNPLVQVMFVLQNTPDVPMFELGNLTISSEIYANLTSKFDITFDLREREDGMIFRVEYCSDLFKEETIERMFMHYHQLLTSVVENIQLPVRSLKMLTPEEERQLLYDFNTSN